MSLQPKYLSQSSLAAYLEVSERQVRVMVGDGRLPKPIYLGPRLPRWDREAVDAALSGKAKSADPLMEDIDASFPERGQTHP